MTKKRYNLKKHNDKWYIDKDGKAFTNVDYLLKHDIEVICSELNNLSNENEQLKKENEKLHSKIFEMRTNKALERTEISKQSYDGYKTELISELISELMRYEPVIFNHNGEKLILYELKEK